MRCALPHMRACTRELRLSMACTHAHTHTHTPNHTHTPTLPCAPGLWPTASQEGHESGRCMATYTAHSAMPPACCTCGARIAHPHPSLWCTPSWSAGRAALRPESLWPGEAGPQGALGVRMVRSAIATRFPLLQDSLPWPLPREGSTCAALQEHSLTHCL